MGRTVEAAKKKPTFELLEDRIAIKLDDPTTTSAGGIVLAQQEQKNSGVVAFAGPGRFIKESGTRKRMDVNVGDHVLLQGRAVGLKHKLNDVEYIILSETDVVAILAD